MAVDEFGNYIPDENDPFAYRSPDQIDDGQQDVSTEEETPSLSPSYLNQALGAAARGGALPAEWSMGGTQRESYPGVGNALDIASALAPEKPAPVHTPTGAYVLGGLTDLASLISAMRRPKARTVSLGRRASGRKAYAKVYDQPNRAPAPPFGAGMSTALFSGPRQNYAQDIRYNQEVNRFQREMLPSLIRAAAPPKPPQPSPSFRTYLDYKGAESRGEVPHGTASLILKKMTTPPGSSEHSTFEERVLEKANTITDPEKRQKYLDDVSMVKSLGKTPKQTITEKLDETEKWNIEHGYATPAVTRTISAVEKAYGGPAKRYRDQVSALQKQRDTLMKIAIGNNKMTIAKTLTEQARRADPYAQEITPMQIPDDLATYDPSTDERVKAIDRKLEFAQQNLKNAQGHLDYLVKEKLGLPDDAEIPSQPPPAGQMGLLGGGSDEEEFGPTLSGYDDSSGYNLPNEENLPMGQEAMTVPPDFTLPNGHTVASYQSPEVWNKMNPDERQKFYEYVLHSYRAQQPGSP